MDRGLIFLGIFLLAVLAAPLFVRELTITEAPFQLQEVVHVRVPVDYNQMDSRGWYLLSFSGCYPYISLEASYYHDGNYVYRYVLFDARDGTVITAGDWTRCYGRDPVSGAYLFHGFVIVDGRVETYTPPYCTDIISGYPSVACWITPVAYRDGYVYLAYAAAVSNEEWGTSPVEYNLYTGLVRVNTADDSFEVLDSTQWDGTYVCPSGNGIYTCIGSPQVDFDGNILRVFFSHYTSDLNYVDIWDFNYDLSSPDASLVGSGRFLAIEQAPPYRGYGQSPYLAKFADGGYLVVVSPFVEKHRVYIPDGNAVYSEPFDIIDDANGYNDSLIPPRAVVSNALIMIGDAVPNDWLTKIGYYTSDATVHVFFSFRRDELGLVYIPTFPLAEYDSNGAIFGFGDFYLTSFLPSQLTDPENMDGYFDAYIFSYNRPVVLPENLSDYVSFPIATGPLEIVTGVTSGQVSPPQAEVPAAGKHHILGGIPELNEAPPEATKPLLQPATPLLTGYAQYISLLVAILIVLALLLFHKKQD